MKYLKVLCLALVLGIIVSAACSKVEPKAPIILATTTSFQDSGLLDVLVQEFKKQSGYELKPISVGSGEAVAMGKRGEADVMVVHSPKDEEAFMQEGFGKSRQPLMYNDYVLVGPETDPAGCKGMKTAAEAFTAISNTNASFISRGDKSGTHKKEQSIWAKANIKPAGTWYVEAGQGMGEVLNMANNKAAYALTDRGTYLAHSSAVSDKGALQPTIPGSNSVASGAIKLPEYRSKASLKIMVEGDPILINPYSVIIPNPAKFPKMNLKGGEKFAEFLLADGTQKMIADFGVDKYGEPLFHIYPKK
ncbi:MAG: substrate-binding domain-containing protein [Planctomycetota bacterium]